MNREIYFSQAGQVNVLVLPEMMWILSKESHQLYCYFK